MYWLYLQQSWNFPLWFVLRLKGTSSGRDPTGGSADRPSCSPGNSGNANIWCSYESNLSQVTGLRVSSRAKGSKSACFQNSVLTFDGSSVGSVLTMGSLGASLWNPAVFGRLFFPPDKSLSFSAEACASFCCLPLDFGVFSLLTISSSCSCSCSAFQAWNSTRLINLKCKKGCTLLTFLRRLLLLPMKRNDFKTDKSQQKIKMTWHLDKSFWFNVFLHFWRQSYAKETFILL